MSYFGLNPVNQNQQLDEAASNPAGFNSDVGFFRQCCRSGIVWFVLRAGGKARSVAMGRDG